MKHVEGHVRKNAVVVIIGELIIVHVGEVVTIVQCIFTYVQLQSASQTGGVALIVSGVNPGSAQSLRTSLVESAAENAGVIGFFTQSGLEAVVRA